MDGKRARAPLSLKLAWVEEQVWTDRVEFTAADMAAGPDAPPGALRVNTPKTFVRYDGGTWIRLSCCRVKAWEWIALSESWEEALGWLISECLLP